MKSRNIFIHHDGALGDTLLSLPCINLIRSSDTHIHMAGRRDVVHFLQEAGIADEVSSADSRLFSSLYAESLDETMRSFLAGFDLSFVFTANTESQLVKNIRSIIPGTRAILTIPSGSIAEHAAEFRVTQFGYSESAGKRKIAICIPDKELIWAAQFLRDQGYDAVEHRLITVHPGSGGERKCWPLENFAALVRYFIKDPHRLCIVCTGPAEDAAAVARQMVCGGRVISLHDESLMRVAALLSQSDFYVGNDSGISHLAGMMGCRGAVLFGPTDPSIWRPQGNDLDVVRFSGSGTEAAPEIISRFSSAITLHESHDIPLQQPKKTSEAVGE